MKKGTHGSFAQSLSQAWLNGAASNRKKLVEAFPDVFPNTYNYYL